MLGFLYALLGLVIAAVLDVALGDPPTRFHPVGWQGRYVDFLWSRRYGVRGKPAGLFVWGLVIVVTGLVVTTLGAGSLQWVAAVLRRSGGGGYGWARLIFASMLCGFVLKGTFSFSGLMKAGASVEAALNIGDLESARSSTAYHLVSRSTADSSESEVCSATLESLSENFTDSVAAPLIYYALGGVTTAWCYRFVNTADAMLGYRDGDKEWGGKAAAKLDDVLSWLPARLSGFLVVLACIPSGADARGAVRVVKDDVKRVPSPNSGWTMAAAAGALGVRLEKTDTYVLNPQGRLPRSEDIRRLSSLLRWSLLFLCLTTIGIIAVVRLLMVNRS
jgi:adenosylcobinamide-phosphate synthase